MEVHVKHTCNSLCAQIALGAKKLVLLDSGDAEIPTSLLIHASYNIKTQQATLHSMEDLNFYSVRLAGVVDREKIAAVLSEVRIENYGLIIARDNNHVLNSKNNNIYHCTPYPSHCTPIEGSALSKLARVFKE